LVNRHGQLRAGLDLGDGAGSQSILRVLAHIDVARELRATAGVDNVGVDLGIADEGGVLLARVDGGAVSCNVGINYARSVVAVGMKSRSSYLRILHWWVSLGYRRRRG
jgi:hypothetical protein